MGEHKTPKLTASLKLTLLDRLTVHRMLAAHKPTSRDDERAMMRVWDVLDLDGLQTAGTPDGEGRITYAAGDLRRVKTYAVDKAHADWLDKLPVAPSGDVARVLAPIRDQVTKALEQLK
jgi:glutamate synthase domain-containing protein 1